MKVHYIHRNIAAGYSINKVSQVYISAVEDKDEHYLPCASATPAAVLKNLLFCIKLRDKNQIFHITGDVHYCVLAFIGCKTVLTIHDTVLLDFQKSGPVKHFLYKLFWYKLPIRFASKVVCISQETKRNVQKYVSRQDISVIYNAIDLDDDYLGRMEYPIIRKRPRILFIGTNPNKNLIRSFDALKGLDCEIRIVGRLNQKQLSSLLENELEYSTVFDLTEEQIRLEYLNADIVSFISLFEGFGMIIIEANAFGRPVICSDIAVLKEVANDSALFVNPYDNISIRDGYIRLLRDLSLCDELILKGYKNVLRFDKKAIVGQWANLYNEMN